MQYGNLAHGQELPDRPQDDHLTATAVNKHSSEIFDAGMVMRTKQLWEEFYQVSLIQVFN